MIKALWVKSAKSNKNSLHNSFSWVLHKRGLLIFSPTAITGCCDIKHEDIDEAVIFSSWLSIIPSYVIRIRTKEQSYQFTVWKFIFKNEYLQFPVRELKNPLILTLVAWTFRATVLAVIFYFLFISLQS